MNRRKIILYMVVFLSGYLLHLSSSAYRKEQGIVSNTSIQKGSRILVTYPTGVVSDAGNHVTSETSRSVAVTIYRNQSDNPSEQVITKMWKFRIGDDVYFAHEDQ